MLRNWSKCWIPKGDLFNENLLLSQFVVLHSHQQIPKSTDQPLSAEVPWPLLRFGSASSRQMWNQFFPPLLLFLIGLTSSSPCLIQSGYSQLGLLDGFRPIRCTGDQMSALSGSMLRCPKMNTRKIALLFLSSLIILHFLSRADGCFTNVPKSKLLHTNNFQWLNHAEKTLLSFFVTKLWTVLQIHSGQI